MKLTFFLLILCWSFLSFAQNEAIVVTAPSKRLVKEEIKKYRALERAISNLESCASTLNPDSDCVGEYTKVKENAYQTFGNSSIENLPADLFDRVKKWEEKEAKNAFAIGRGQLTDFFENSVYGKSETDCLQVKKVDDARFSKLAKRHYRSLGLWGSQDKNGLDQIGTSLKENFQKDLCKEMDFVVNSQNKCNLKIMTDSNGSAISSGLIQFEDENKKLYILNPRGQKGSEVVVVDSACRAQFEDPVFMVFEDNENKKTLIFLKNKSAHLRSFAVHEGELMGLSIIIDPSKNFFYTEFQVSQKICPEIDRGLNPRVSLVSGASKLIFCNSKNYIKATPDQVKANLGVGQQDQSTIESKSESGAK